MAEQSIRVLIVDDSAVVRGILHRALSEHPRIEVIGAAFDGNDALKKLAALRPDVVTLDVEMPNMNGLQVLERVGGKLPVSFLMCSTLTQAGAKITLEALRRGAFDYITKPDASELRGNDDFKQLVQQKVLAAFNAKGRIRQVMSGAATARAPELAPNRARGWLVGIGISCGGPQTLHDVLPAFPSDFVPIIITQHMPAGFTRSFAAQLDAECAMHVREAGDNERVKAGEILIAPGSHHLKLVRRGVELFTSLDAGPKVSGHRPAADVMFASMARACGARCIAVVMTGMGGDGAAGIQQLHQAGAFTMAQDEATSLVFGMPKVAAATGCVREIVAMRQMPHAVARVIGAAAPVRT